MRRWELAFDGVLAWKNEHAASLLAEPPSPPLELDGPLRPLVRMLHMASLLVSRLSQIAGPHGGVIRPPMRPPFPGWRSPRLNDNDEIHLPIRGFTGQAPPKGVKASRVLGPNSARPSWAE
ncbi:hypothetical protein CCHR01_02904 [Colletotrichum chrysophilum]|uniref:Uncharacterized protein n=1 Tax=Colletotrichum chrysophilum TaxID=1836956 RepID=A0AAD9AZE1_9PEZI|nr:hypothetical protein CCHR01_02904 [Colletotrichum chrysophilum]